MPTVLIAGAFGQGDPGDEALLTALLAGLPGWEVVAASNRPRESEAAHGCRAVQARNPAAVARAMSNSDAVVLAGGTPFKLLGSTNGRRRSALLRNALAVMGGARAMRKRRAMIGVGADVLSTPVARRLAREIVRHADLTVLRDEESAGRLAEAGASAPFRVGADLAWRVLGEPRQTRPGDRTVTVALNGCSEELVERLSLGLGRLVEAGLEVRLQPWRGQQRGPDDVRLAGALAGRIGGPVRVLSPPGGIHAARESFAECGLVLGLRYHSLIAAAMAGTPCLAVAHEPELADLARRLGQPVVAGDTTPSALAGAVLEALDHPPASRSAIQGQVASAEESLRLLRLLLSPGEYDEANDLTGLPLKPTAAA